MIGHFNSNNLFRNKIELIIKNHILKIIIVIKPIIHQIREIVLLNSKIINLCNSLILMILLRNKIYIHRYKNRF